MSAYCVLAFHQTSAIVLESEISSVSQPLAIPNELKHYVNQQGLQGNKTVGILAPSDYQLLRITRPEAQASEMVSAILWQEQAKFSLPIDQIFIDYLECPEVVTTSATQEKRLYVVAVAKRTLKERYQAFLTASLLPFKITLPEFVYAQYVSKNYASEPLVVWVNYFQDAPQVFAFYKKELVATLRLPKIEGPDMTESCLMALNLFYLAEIKRFSASPLWLMNGVVNVSETCLQQITGRVHYLKDNENIKASSYLKSLEKHNHSTVSHAYFGVLAHE